MKKKNTIRLEIRSVRSPDIEFYSWEPSTDAEVFFLVEMEIGEAGVDGADLFQIVVATPEALRSRAKLDTNIIRERCTLVVSHFEWRTMQESLESIVRRCEADNWINSTINLQRYFKWEYENYQSEGSP